MTHGLTARVGISLEDEIRVTKNSDTDYIYSFYSKGRQEFSKNVNSFEYIENSVLNQYKAFGADIIDKLKNQLHM